MYGSVEHATKEDEPIKPSSPYAASKVAFDMYLESVHKFLKFPMNIIRPSNAYCPGQLLHRVIPKSIWCGLTGHKLPLHGGGRAVDDRWHAVVRADGQELGLELVSRADVHGVELVVEPNLFEEHCDLVAIGRRPIIEF